MLKVNKSVFIDWFTVIAQALNFLILVWLLKRFLYQPILDGIDAREQRIAKTLANADQKQHEAQQAREEFQHKKAVFADQRQALFQDATAAAEKERQRLFNAARQQADAFSAQRQKKIQAEELQLQDELRRLICEEVFTIAHQVLTDLAGVDVEQKMIDIFLLRMNDVDLNDITVTTKKPLSINIEPVQIQTSFELLPDQQAVIQAAFNQIFATELMLEFQINSKLICGIELNIRGQKLAWSIAEYLTSLDKKLGQLMAQTSETVSLKPRSKINYKE